MIYTLTTNPAIDMNISLKHLRYDEINRLENVVYTPNGKGLNISYVLNHFNLSSKILGFFGGFTGNYIVEETQKKDIDIIPFWVDETTRINIFLNESGKESKLLNKGAFVSESQQNELLDFIKNASDMEYLAISGSLPPGIDEMYYDELLTICEQNQVKVILDISSTRLKHLLKFRPFLIKPNDEELKSIFNIHINDEDDIIDALQMLYEKGAQNILFTLGENGSYFYDGLNLYYASAHQVELVSSACAGDTALASFLSIWLDNSTNIELALKRAAAAGANVAESDGIGDLVKVDEYMNYIKVRKIR